MLHWNRALSLAAIALLLAAQNWPGFAQDQNDPYTPIPASPKTAADIHIVVAGSFVVPGSQQNAIRYTWRAAGPAPSAVTLSVLDKNGHLARQIDGLPVKLLPDGYAELTWNGLDMDGVPLAERDSPYTLQLDGLFPNGPSTDRIIAKVEEWKLGIVISDPATPDTLSTGVDRKTVNDRTLRVSISLDWQSDKPTWQTPPFDVSQQIPGDGSCEATPQYIFYVTPDEPYEIRYQMRIEQLGAGVQDNVLNPWDMDPDQPGRQTKGTWKFGLDSETTITGKDLRKHFEEKYE